MEMGHWSGKTIRATRDNLLMINVRDKVFSSGMMGGYMMGCGREGNRMGWECIKRLMVEREKENGN